MAWCSHVLQTYFLRLLLYHSITEDSRQSSSACFCCEENVFRRLNTLSAEALDKQQLDNSCPMRKAFTVCCPPIPLFHLRLILLHLQQPRDRLVAPLELSLQCSYHLERDSFETLSMSMHLVSELELEQDSKAVLPVKATNYCVKLDTEFLLNAFFRLCYKLFCGAALPEAISRATAVVFR